MVRVTPPPRGGKSKVVFLDRPSASPSIAQPSILGSPFTHIRIQRRSVGPWSLGPCRKTRIQPPLGNSKKKMIFCIKIDPRYRNCAKISVTLFAESHLRRNRHDLFFPSPLSLQEKVAPPPPPSHIQSSLSHGRSAAADGEEEGVTQQRPFFRKKLHFA